MTAAHNHDALQLQRNHHVVRMSIDFLLLICHFLVTAKKALPSNFKTKP